MRGFCSSLGSAEGDPAEYTSSNAPELLDLVAERVALFGGVADRPVVLAVLALIGIRRWGLLPGRGK